MISLRPVCGLPCASIDAPWKNVAAAIAHTEMTVAQMLRKMPMAPMMPDTTKMLEYSRTA